jgi:hypothetical protein
MKFKLVKEVGKDNRIRLFYNKSNLSHDLIVISPKENRFERIKHIKSNKDYLFNIINYGIRIKINKKI